MKTSLWAEILAVDGSAKEQTAKPHAVLPLFPAFFDKQQGSSRPATVSEQTDSVSCLMKPHAGNGITIGRCLSI
jgi:hypothetical protein